MCGIVGYVGQQDALPIIISGLERLEYRGYDSAGVAVIEDGELVVTRALGKLSELKKILSARPRTKRAQVGIGHTRWATHGRPSETNAHPHTAGSVSLIHNGIIENYLELRERLRASGVIFQSETDTEIAAQLLNQYILKGLDPFAALKAMCADLRGSYAFVALDAAHPDRLLVAKNATPIIIGVNGAEMIVASDIPAILSHTRRVIVLEDGDLAEVRANGVRIEHNGQPVERSIQTVSWDPVTAQKGGFKHFMLKEIHEQPQALADTFRGRLELESATAGIAELMLEDEVLRQVNRIVLLACGTAWHACLVGKFYIETLAQIPCEVDYASEFRYRKALFDERTLVIAVSQSGETADTLAAVDLALKRSPGIAVCNVVGSSLARKMGQVVYTHAGPEISVASTKAFTTQLVALLVLAMHLAERRGVRDKTLHSGVIAGLLHLPTAVETALTKAGLVEEVAKKFHTASDFLFLGRGMCYPIALEGALKLKEISYIHAEGYPAGEMKHGPIALIDEKLPVVVVIQKSALILDKTVSNLKEVEARRGRIIAVTDCSGHPELHAVAETVIELPFVHEFVSPVILTVPLQLLAYYVAELNGTDVDLPRNLAKSVTVE